MNEKTRFVWRSTPESIEQQIPSVLAWVEIAIAVAAYWLIAWYWDTHWHLLSSVFVAPLLLLRSPQSIACGIKLFNFKNKVQSHGFTIFLVNLLISLITVFISWYLLNNFLYQYEGFVLFGFMFVLFSFTLILTILIKEEFSTGEVIIVWLPVVVEGVVFSLTSFSMSFLAMFIFVSLVSFTSDIKDLDTSKVSKEELLASNIVSLPIILLMACAFYFQTVLIRAKSTIRYLPEGISYFRNNWAENMWAIDVFYHPSLIPGYDDLTASAMLKEKVINNNDAFRLFQYSIIPFIYIPAFVYRLSIKSTFWFYWPVAYIRYGLVKHEVDRHVMLKQLVWHPAEWLRLGLGVLTVLSIVYFATSGFAFNQVQDTSPTMMFAYIFAVDIGAIKPWQWLQLCTVGLTLFLWGRAITLLMTQKTFKEHGEVYGWRGFKLFNMLFRLRNLTTVLYLLMAVAFLALYLPETYEILPDTVTQKIGDFFGMAVPIRLGVTQ